MPPERTFDCSNTNATTPPTPSKKMRCSKIRQSNDENFALLSFASLRQSRLPLRALDVTFQTRFRLEPVHLDKNTQKFEKSDKYEENLSCSDGFALRHSHRRPRAGRDHDHQAGQEEIDRRTERVEQGNARQVRHR